MPNLLGASLSSPRGNKQPRHVFEKCTLTLDERLPSPPQGPARHRTCLLFIEQSRMSFAALNQLAEAFRGGRICSISV
jgi:hypothetical protein